MLELDLDIAPQSQKIKLNSLNLKSMFVQQDIIDTSIGHPIGKELLFRTIDNSGKPVSRYLDELNYDCPLLFDRFVSASALAFCQNHVMTMAIKQIHININHTSLNDPGVLNNLLALYSFLNSYGMLLVIELVEYTMPTSETIYQAKMLQEHGLRVAIDDLGQGFNTVENLKGLIKPDYVKLVYNSKLLALLDGVEFAISKFDADLDNIIVEFIDSEQKSKSMDAIGLCIQQGFFFRD